METFKKGTVLLLGFLPALVFAQQNNTTNAPVPHSMPMSVSTAHDAAIKANSYDSDGDGIPDSTDACLLVKGLPQYQGCPYPKNITPTDQDGDGVADAFDACPDMFGTKENHGCPVLVTGTISGNVDTLFYSTSAFTTTTSSQQTRMDDFKKRLNRVIADAPNSFTTIKTTEGGVKPGVCVYGAECRIDMDKALRYTALYGIYNNEDWAAAKYIELKQLLTEALGEVNWTTNEDWVSGKLKHYEMKSKDEKLANATVSAWIVRQNNGTYMVYLTVEKRSL